MDRRFEAVHLHLRRRLWITLTLACVLLSTPAAMAQGTAAQRAQQLYGEGAASFKAKRFEEAAEKFQQAYNLDPSPILLYNLARSYEQLGDAAKAVEHYRQYLTVYPDAEDRSEVEKHISVLEAIRQAAQRPGQLFIDELPAGASVQFNEAPAPAPNADGSWGLLPGDYTISVRMGADAPPWTTQTRVDPGKTARVKYTGARTAPEPVDEGVDLALPGYIALGVGAIGAGVGTFFALQASGAQDDYNSLVKKLDQNVTDPNDSRLDDLQGFKDDAESAETLTNVFISIGALGIATGATLLVIDKLSGGGADEPAAEASIQLLPGPSGFSLAGSF